VIEKDYVLGWVLDATAAEPALAQTWIFKGGTCLRKCYYETYRFSEDLDFTILDGGPTDPHQLREIFLRVASWLREQSGVELIIDERTFVQRRNLRGNPTTQARRVSTGHISSSTQRMHTSPAAGERACSSTIARRWLTGAYTSTADAGPRRPTASPTEMPVASTSARCRTRPSSDGWASNSPISARERSRGA